MAKTNPTPNRVQTEEPATSSLPTPGLFDKVTESEYDAFLFEKLRWDILGSFPHKPDCNALAEEVGQEHESIQQKFEDDEKVYRSVGLSFDLAESSLKAVDSLLTRFPHDELGIARMTSRQISEEISDLQQDHGVVDTPALFKASRELKAWVQNLETDLGLPPDTGRKLRGR